MNQNLILRATSDTVLAFSCIVDRSKDETLMYLEACRTLQTIFKAIREGIENDSQRVSELDP